MTFEHELMTKAVIFDFDGVILDTEFLWYKCINTVLKQYGHVLNRELFRGFLGTRDCLLFEYLKKEIQIDPEIIRDKAIALFFDMLIYQQPKRGVRQYLEDARELGLKIGLASNSDRHYIDDQLKRLNLHDFFDVIKTADDTENHKPNPDLYLQVLNDMEIKSCEAVAFEDSPSGATAARKAGIPCVVVNNALTEEIEINCNLRIRSMHDFKLGKLLQLLSEEENGGNSFVSNKRII